MIGRVSVNINQYLMGEVTNQLIRRMNNPSYIIHANDQLISLFGRGEKDLREFVEEFNSHLVNAGLPKLRYSKKLTYRKVLTSFIDNYEQIKIHESKRSTYSE